MRRGIVIFVYVICIFSFACKKKNKSNNFIFPDDTGNAVDTENENSQGRIYAFEDMQQVFGFYGESRYSYAPSVIKLDDGTTHLFFCGTKNMVMIDHVYHIRIDQDGSQTDPEVVLSPGKKGSWNDHHTCDPSVIEGSFNMGGTNYKYALFYLSNAYGVYYNEIGVAFSNDLDSDHWTKYPYQVVKKTWDYDGDQMIGSNKSWGVGQPSAISLNHKGEVLLIYTVGDIKGTRIVWAKIDLSDMDEYEPASPTTMIKKGLLDIHKKNIDITTDADFAIDTGSKKIVMVRPVHPNSDNSYPTYIEDALEVDYISLKDFYNSTGSWIPMVRIDDANTGFPRNHNAGIERNPYGEIKDWQNPVIYYTVSKASPDVAPEGTKFAEWTYHIWKGKVVHKK